MKIEMNEDLLKYSDGQNERIRAQLCEDANMHTRSRFEVRTDSALQCADRAIGGKIDMSRKEKKE